MNLRRNNAFARIQILLVCTSPPDEPLTTAKIYEYAADGKEGIDHWCEVKVEVAGQLVVADEVARRIQDLFAKEKQ